MFVCRVSLFDYQAMCKNSHHHASSARPLLSVSLVTAAHTTASLYNTELLLVTLGYACGYCNNVTFGDCGLVFEKDEL